MTMETPDSPPLDTAGEGQSDSDSLEAEASAQYSELPEAFIIPRVLAQATLDYLAMRPYREVFALVKAFEELEPVPRDQADPRA